jgi:hypothetical protein
MQITTLSSESIVSLMKKYCCLIAFASLLSINYGQAIRFFSVKKNCMNISEKLGLKPNENCIEIPAFSISKQITLKQYKTYLKSIEKDSSYAFFLSQHPKIDFQESLTKKYLTVDDFDNEPVIGVSMDNACNFARWYTAIQGKKDILYRLPTVVEWISMNEQFAIEKNDKLDTVIQKKRTWKKKTKKRESNNKNVNLHLLDWTINAFDESIYQYHDLTKFPLGHIYKHEHYEPKVMKRKCVIGKSFRISLADPVKIASLYSYYADEGYADVGFRLIEVSVNDPFWNQKKQEPIQSDIILNPESIIKTLPLSTENIQNHSIELSNQQIDFTTRNGMLDGSFIVYKKVNDKKIILVKGEMKNNCRTGYWTIYDEKEAERIVIKRLYKSNLEFDQLIPNHSSNKLISFVESNLNPSLGYDKYGCKEYFPVKEADIIYSKRLYREILFEKNKFSGYSIIESLKSATQRKELIAYSIDNFSRLTDKDPFENFLGNFLGFRIKEDFFFDKNRKIAETRIIGLAPIFVDSITNEKKELCWYYFPYLRKFLVNEIDPYYDTNMDNIFLERNFFGSVYKLQNISNQSDSINKQKQLDYQDINLLLDEHKIWLFLEGLADEY